MAEIVIVPSAAAAGARRRRDRENSSARPDAVLGLAAGSTPLSVYRALRPRVAGLDLSRVRRFAFNQNTSASTRTTRRATAR